MATQRRYSIEFKRQVVQEYRSEEHTSELQSQSNLVCRLLLEKKNQQDFLDANPFDITPQPDHHLMARLARSETPPLAICPPARGVYAAQAVYHSFIVTHRPAS